MSASPSLAGETLNDTGTRTPSVLVGSSNQSTHSLVKPQVSPIAERLSEKLPEKLLEKEPDRSPSSLEQGSSESQKTRDIHGIRWFLVCLALYITALLYGLDTTIAADVQASVISTFGSVEQLTWLGSGFPLGSVAIILLVGSLYSKFDQKAVYILSIVFFEVGSALCGAAPSMTALIVGRIIAGMGGAGVYLGALNYFTIKTSPNERGAYIAGIGFVWGAGCILGPIIGGSFSDSAATWRWAFYINIPIAGIFAPVYIFFLPSVDLAPTLSLKTKLAHIDFVGFVLSAATWVSFTLVLTFAGATWPWDDGRTITLFVVFGVLLVLFVLQQYFLIGTTAENRLLPLHLLRSRTQILLYAATSALVTSMFIPIYYLPLYFQFVSNDSALMAAVRLLPFIAFFVVVSLVSGFLLSRLPWYSLLYLISSVFLLVSGGLFYTLSPSTPMANVYGYSIIGAVGAGLACQTGYTVATTKAPEGAADAVNAISLQNVSQIGSTVIALVISGQIFQSVAFRNISAALAGLGFSSDDLHAAVAGTQSAVFDSLQGGARDSAIHAITDAMDTVFTLLIVAGGVVLISAVAMRREKLT